MARFRHGWLDLGEARGVPVRVHWTTVAPLAFLAVAAGTPGGALAWAGLVLLHLAGHVVAIRRAGGRVVAVDLTPVGGECHHDGVTGQRARLAVAAAGPAVHLLLAAAAGLGLAAGGAAFGPTVRAGLGFGLLANLLLLVVNLLPVAPLDGADAWRARAPDAAERR